MRVSKDCETINVQANQELHYGYRMVGSDLQGYSTQDGGFVVLRGSVISGKVAPSFELAGKYYFRMREQLIANSVIKDGVFQQDYQFSSPTGAASVCLGRTVSGRAAWKLNKERSE